MAGYYTDEYEVKYKVSHYWTRHAPVQSRVSTHALESNTDAAMYMLTLWAVVRQPGSKLKQDLNPQNKSARISSVRKTC